MRKIDVPRRVDQIQLVFLTVGGCVGKRDRFALDRDAAFAFDVHRVENLVVKFALRHTTTGLDQPIGQRRLAVIDVGDNAEVTNVFHVSSF